MTDAMSVAGIILLAAFGLIVFQEAVNGFHDVANAIATVIYSNAMQPVPAVMLAAVCNFLGVLLGGTAVAFSLVYLLPSGMVAGVDTAGEAALFFAMIFTALFWNFATWWLAIPSSTTHAYVGAIIGVSMADAFLSGKSVVEQINWHQSEKIMLALLLSPIVGFLLGVALLWLIRRLVSDKAMFQPTEPGRKPPRTIRGILIAGSAGVSLLHGSNDGQKSIGLMMIVLFGLMPAVYGLDPGRLTAQDRSQLVQTVETVQAVSQRLPQPALGEEAGHILTMLQDQKDLHGDADEKRALRKEILDLHQEITRTLKTEQRMAQMPQADVRALHDAHAMLEEFVEHVPFWVILLSAVALGGGTLVGYQRIVTTLGEKMGSSRMNPAQGTAAQISAVASIAMADFGGMPVSTTHVLSSSVVGTVAATPGQSINTQTLSRILMTWVTTLPSTTLLAFALGIVFHLAFA